MRTLMRPLGLFLLISIFMLVGKVAAEVVTFQDNWGSQGFTLLSQSQSGVEVNFSVTEMYLDSFIQGSDTLTSVGIPEAYFPNQPGAPNLPEVGRALAFPRDATVSVEIIQSRAIAYENLNLAPAFELPLETDSLRTPEKDMRIYSHDDYFPDSPVKIVHLDKLRGLDMVQLAVCPFQYNPVSKQLIVYQDLRIRVKFRGGNGYFGFNNLRNRRWEPILENHVYNYLTLPRVNFQNLGNGNNINLDDIRLGAEYYIYIPNAMYAPWADSVKTWRNKQGIKTEVVLIDSIGGDIYGHLFFYYTICMFDSLHYVAPEEFFIFSDDAGPNGIPSISYNFKAQMGISDNYYADLDGDPNGLPDLVGGRVCVRDTTEQRAYVQRLLALERNPPSNPSSFYQSPLIAGGWESYRWFGLNWETIRGHMVNQLGKIPNHQYCWYDLWQGSLSYWCTYPYAMPSTETIVSVMSSLGYIPTTATYLTNLGWLNQGSTAGITAAFTNGVYLALYRCHGSATGWGYPAFHNSNLNGLTHPYNQFPFVLSITCLSGQFNYGGEGCFAEKFTRMNPEPQYTNTRGAIGVIAASNISYSYVGDVMTWGWYDFMNPNFIPGYGSPSSGITQNCPAFALVSGKVFVVANGWSDFMSQPPFPYYNYKKETSYLYHHFGEPNQVIYTAVPESIQVTHPNHALPWLFFSPWWFMMPIYFPVTAPVGSVIAITNTTSNYIYGVANGTGSPVTFTLPPTCWFFTVTVTMPNHYRYEYHIPKNWWDGLDQTSPNQTSNIEAAVAKEFSVTASPNPFNAEISLKVVLPEADQVQVSLYDMNGRRVTNLYDQLAPAGDLMISYNAQELPSGVYLCRTVTSKHQTINKLVLIK